MIDITIIIPWEASHNNLLSVRLLPQSSVFPSFSPPFPTFQYFFFNGLFCHQYFHGKYHWLLRSKGSAGQHWLKSQPVTAGLYQPADKLLSTQSTMLNSAHPVPHHWDSVDITWAAFKGKNPVCLFLTFRNIRQTKQKNGLKGTAKVA